MDNISLLKMKNKTKFGIFGVFLLLLIISSFNVSSSGVSSPYWDENPMYAQPDEVKEFSYTLQNMVGTENIQMKAETEGDKNIIHLVDTNTIYNVPIGSSDVKVPVKITVPKDAKEGDEFQVGVRFTAISENKGQPVTIGAAFSKGFKVIVGKPTPIVNENTNAEVGKSLLSNQVIGFLILVVILIILLFAIKYFHKKRENK